MFLHLGNPEQAKNSPVPSLDLRLTMSLPHFSHFLPVASTFGFSAFGGVHLHLG
jgi:hypothetical protein